MRNKELFPVQIAQSKQITLMPESLIRQVNTASDAVKTMVTYSDGTYESIANGFGKPKETVTRFVNDNGGLKPSDLYKFFDQCDNLFFIQHYLYTRGFSVVKRESVDIRRAELLAELESLGKVA